MRDPRYWNPAQPGRAAFVQAVTRGWEEVTAAEGGQRMVAVRGYTRVVDGKPQDVGPYVQGRSSARQGEAQLASGGGPAATTATPKPVPGRPVVLFIGGAADAQFRPVQGFFEQFEKVYPQSNTAYFSHEDRDLVLQRIAALPPGTQVTLVGHSWGAQEAIRIAAERGAAGQPIATLITIDPVGNGQSAALLARARRGAGRWINVQATGGGWSEPSNLIARIGNRYGEAPRTYATEFIQAPEIHANFGRMLQSRIAGGGTIADLLFGRRPSP